MKILVTGSSIVPSQVAYVLTGNYIKEHNLNYRYNRIHEVATGVNKGADRGVLQFVLEQGIAVQYIKPSFLGRLFPSIYIRELVKKSRASKVLVIVTKGDKYCIEVIRELKRTGTPFSIAGVLE